MILYKLSFPNGKAYVGITSTSLQRRLSLHRSHAKREIRGHLQRAIRKYGASSFTAEILETSDNWALLCDLEKAAIKRFDTFGPNGYNSTAGGEGTLGFKMKPEQIRRAIESRGCRKGIAPRPAGWHHSEESREKIASAGKGRIFTEERKAKIGASKMGNKYCLGIACSNEKREKIAAAQKGRKFSDEHKENMSKSCKGKSFGPHSAEWNQKISIATKGRKVSEETRAKISASKKGGHWTESRRRSAL
jgi:group I intron endonuclease